MPDIHLFGFETSNNIKVRIALDYKKLPFQWHAIDPADRSRIAELSGQFLTPVLVHGEPGRGGRVVFDSAAILRDLDVTFPDTPKLFGTSRLEQWRIEDLELFARTTLAGPMLELVHRRTAGEDVPAEEVERLGVLFGQAAAKIAREAARSTWLVGDTMTAADITNAAVLARVQRSGLFPLPKAVEECADWLGRVLAHDRVPS